MHDARFMNAIHINKPVHQIFLQILNVHATPLHAPRMSIESATVQHVVTSDRTPRTLRYSQGTSKSRLLIIAYCRIVELIKKVREPIGCDALASWD
jgi:hypothetical protein